MIMIIMIMIMIIIIIHISHHYPWSRIPRSSSYFLSP